MKRKLCFWFSVLICMTVLVCWSGKESKPSYAGEGIDISMDSDGYYLLDTYEELVYIASNPKASERFRLAGNILETDKKTDNMILLNGSGKVLHLDLNGYTLSRETRGADSALFCVKNDAQLFLYDHSPTQTGECRFETKSGPGYVVYQSGGYTTIYGGSYYLNGVYDRGSVIYAESGQLEIHGGLFDARECGHDMDVSVVQLLHMAPLYEVPRCVIYDGLFYGTNSVLDASSFDAFLKYGCLFPSIYVLGGEFYLTEYLERGAGFAYCNNGWGRIIVAGGFIPEYSLNNDDTYVPGVIKEKSYSQISGQVKKYYWVTPPPVISSLEMPAETRLIRMCLRKDLEYYRSNQKIQELYQDIFEDLNNNPDSFTVTSYEEEFPWLWCSNYFVDDQIRWYFADEEHYQGENTPWSELGDYADWFLPWSLNVRPENTTFYIRSVVSRADTSVVEDVIAIHFEDLIRSLQGTATIAGGSVQYGNTVKVQLNDIPQWQEGTYIYEWTIDGTVVGTDQEFTIDKPGYIGKNLMCTVKNTVHPGALSTTPWKIGKADNDQHPLYHSADYSDGMIHLTYLDPNQEYLFTEKEDAALLTEGDWSHAMRIQSYSAGYTVDYLGLNELLGSTIYIYTRYPETLTSKAGSDVLCTPLLLAEVVPLQSLSFRDLKSNNTIYIPFTGAGDKVTLEYDLNPINANQWSSFMWRTYYPVSVKDPVSSVTPSNNTGKVTLELITTGSTTLTAYYITNTEVRYAMITIVVYDPENFLIGPANLLSPLPDVTIAEGQSYFCKLPEMYPEVPEGTEFTWYLTEQDGPGQALQKFTHGSVAMIIPDTGEIYGLGYGTTNVTLFSPIGVELDTFKLTVTTWDGELPVAEIYLNKKEMTLKEREYAVLSTYIYPTNATNQTVTWSSSDPYVATVDAYGRVKALNQGTTKIRATAGDVYAECTVTVLQGDFSSVILTPDTCPKDETCPMYVYTDLDRNSWYHDGVHYCLEEGLMTGTSATTFAPNMITNRAMVVTILYRLEGSPAVNASHPFTDLTADWYKDAVIWAYNNSIVNGTSATTFAPDQVVTREQIATMLYRYAQYKGYDVSHRNDLTQFPDRNEASSWALDALKWAVAEGLISGAVKDNQTILLPQGEAARCQFATILYRFDQ